MSFCHLYNSMSLNFPSSNCLCKENAQCPSGSLTLLSSISHQDEPSKQPVQIFLSEPIVICLPEVGDVNITISSFVSNKEFPDKLIFLSALDSPNCLEFPDCHEYPNCWELPYCWEYPNCLERPNCWESPNCLEFPYCLEFSDCCEFPYCLEFPCCLEFPN